MNAVVESNQIAVDTSNLVANIEDMTVKVRMTKPRVLSETFIALLVAAEVSKAKQVEQINAILALYSVMTPKQAAYFDLHTLDIQTLRVYRDTLTEVLQ